MDEEVTLDALTKRVQAFLTNEATHAVEAPKRLDTSRYDVGRQIGAGGMGAVMLATDKALARPVALKLLFADDDDARRRFSREAGIASRLEHPNIVPLYDAGVDGTGKPYLAMRYVEGDTLRAIIRRLSEGDSDSHRRWPMEARCRIALQVLSALELAHARGVLHRDIKPENVMIGPFGEVLLLDWGIACSPDETARVDEVSGTARYMSPEQARGQPLDARSDVYSVSVMLYELLTTVHPFAELPAKRKTDAAPLAAEHRRSPFQPALPRALSLVVMRGMDASRDRRFPSASSLREAIELVLAGQAPIVCPHTAYQRSLNAIGHVLDAWPRFIYATTSLLLLLAAVGTATVVRTLLEAFAP